LLSSGRNFLSQKRILIRLKLSFSKKASLKNTIQLPSASSKTFLEIGNQIDEANDEKEYQKKGCKKKCENSRRPLSGYQLYLKEVNI
jgi:hypothetical protein